MSELDAKKDLEMLEILLIDDADTIYNEANLGLINCMLGYLKEVPEYWIKRCMELESRIRELEEELKHCETHFKNALKVL